MKKLLIALVFTISSASAQQRVEIKDTVLIAVLNQFINEKELFNKSYGILKVRMECFTKEFKTEMVDTVKIGNIVGRTARPREVLKYSFVLETSVNSQTIEFDPVTYYAVYRGIPILLISGLETFVGQTNDGNKELRKLLQRRTGKYAAATSATWLVKVYEGVVTIERD